MESTGFFDDYMPHGHCYLWNKQILFLNVFSDAFIAIAYFFIPFALYYFFRNRPDFPFRSVIAMFSVFIFTCGLSHVMGIWTIWNGSYGMQGLLKAATALASVATALLLIPVMPQLLALRSPRELEAANAALTHEIGERKQTEQRTQRFVEAAPDGIVIVDAQERIRVVNNRAEVMFGKDRDDLLGSPVEAILPNFRKSTLSGLIQKAAANSGKVDLGAAVDYSGLNSTGKHFPVEINLSSVGTQEQALFSLSIRDVTERDRLERQTRSLQQQIAHVDRLDTMGQMAAGLAHEINQPLTALAQNADSAILWAEQKEQIDPELKEILQDIESQAHRAGDIIRALRQFVANDDASKESFDLSELVNKTQRLVESDAKRQSVRVENNIPSRTFAHGAPVQVAQVFVNLLRNSIEAMSSTDDLDRLIEISSRQDGSEVEITVSDTGPGLPEQQNDIFTPFQSKKIDGMGMGLSICRSIVESHGGTFKTDRNRDKGAAFIFTLPSGGMENEMA